MMIPDSVAGFVWGVVLTSWLWINVLGILYVVGAIEDRG